jgi:molybdopterin molybdotransferase
MPLISLDDARSLISRVVPPLLSIDLPLAEARGRVLREDVLAPEDLPAFDRSAMDGYAVQAGDTSPKFRVIAELQAGQTSEVEIRPGECARIFTGAQIPPGATQVIMQEETERDGEWMIARKRDTKTWIRQRGEDARRGDRLLGSGARLGSGELSLLAQLGHIRPRVSPAPRVMHLTTGDELVDPAERPGAGQIRDSNSTLVASLLAEAGAKLIAQGRCGDTLFALTEAVALQPLDSWDVLLISGGASVGDYDFGFRALEELGFTTHFRQMNLRPGKPLIFATRGSQLAFVLPGNPVSHFVTFHVAVRLALECLEGGTQSWPLVAIEVGTDLPTKSDARETWWPAQVVAEDGVLRARPLTWQSSGDLRGLVSANALLRIAPGTHTIERGTRLPVLPLNTHW